MKKNPLRILWLILGFEHFYGILAGASSYLKPQGGRGLTLDNTNLPAPNPPIIQRMLLLIMPFGL